MSEWKQIHTAPKDGTTVIVCGRGVAPYVASFRYPVRGEPQNESHFVPEWRDSNGRWTKPSHWMPLPELPAF